MNIRLRGLCRAVGLSCTILLTAATTAQADQTPHTYGFKAGYWIPGEELFRDVLGSGLSVGAAYSLPLRPDRWIDFEILYWRGKGDLPLLEGDSRSSDVTLVPLALSFRAELSPRRGIQPFVLGGVDLNIVKEEVDFLQTGAGQTDSRGTNSLSNAFLGIHIGGGAQYEVNPKALLYLEARLSIANADTRSVGGVVGNGVSLGGTGIFAGIRIR